MLSIALALLLAQAPLGVGQVPTSSLPSFPPASYVQHIFFDATTKCLMHTHGGTSWRCLAETGEVTSAISAATSGLASTGYVDGAAATVSGNIPTVPRIFLAPTSSAPSTSTVGASYYNTTMGCMQTWTGSAWTPVTCPLLTAPAQPTAPNTFLSPTASDPATSVTGATYFNTTGKCLKTWNGSTWSPATCPTTATVASVPNAASPPTGTAPGDMFNDTVQGCTRRYSGSSWGQCLTTEACGTATVTGITLPIGLSTPTSTATIAGAVAGRPCTVSAPSGSLLNVGVSATCSITSANTASFRMQGSLGLAIVGGTYIACTHIPW